MGPKEVHRGEEGNKETQSNASSARGHLEASPALLCLALPWSASRLPRFVLFFPESALPLPGFALHKALLCLAQNTLLAPLRLIGCIRHPMKQLAHSVRDCMKGWGTDDEGLITCLVHLEDFKKAALIKEYKAEFGRDIFADIKADTSGAYEKALCDLVKPAPQVWAESLTSAMKGLGTADALLINFMVLAKDDMMEVRTHFHKQNGKMLEDWIESETSGDYKNTLLMLAGRNSEETT